MFVETTRKIEMRTLKEIGRIVNSIVSTVTWKISNFIRKKIVYETFSQRLITASTCCLFDRDYSVHDIFVSRRFRSLHSSYKCFCPKTPPNLKIQIVEYDSLRVLAQFSTKVDQNIFFQLALSTLINNFDNFQETCVQKFVCFVSNETYHCFS